MSIELRGWVVSRQGKKQIVKATYRDTSTGRYSTVEINPQTELKAQKIAEVIAQKKGVKSNEIIIPKHLPQA